MHWHSPLLVRLLGYSPRFEDNRPVDLAPNCASLYSNNMIEIYNIHMFT